MKRSFRNVKSSRETRKIAKDHQQDTDLKTAEHKKSLGVEIEKQCTTLKSKNCNTVTRYQTS